MFQRILVALRLSHKHKSDDIISTALRMAKCCRGYLFFFTVLDYHLDDSQVAVKSREAEIQFQKAYAPLLGNFKDYRFFCRKGVPAFEIARFANSQDIDCIIVGGHIREDGRPAVGRMGENALEILEWAKCPVIILPQIGENKEQTGILGLSSAG